MEINNKELKIIDQMATDLFCIGETLVSQSKQEITNEEAIKKIREYSLRSSNMSGLTRFWLKVYKELHEEKKKEKF